jgi:hypothetical protein
MCEKKEFESMMDALPAKESPRSAIAEQRMAQFALYSMPTVLVGLWIIESFTALP